MQETHDLYGWIEKLHIEEMQLSEPGLMSDEISRCVLHIAVIAEHIKHQVDFAIHHWNMKRQFHFFIDGERVRKHSAFESYADMLAVNSLKLAADPDHILHLTTQFQVELFWLLDQMNQPEWHEAVTDDTMSQPTQAELEELPVEALLLKSIQPKRGRGSGQSH